MSLTQGYAVKNSTAHFEPFSFHRRSLSEHDVLIKILFCGICHSDIHQARNEWGKSIYPMVPGHEIIGCIEQIGTAVTKHKLGDIVGVGCFVDSCRFCSSCQAHEEQFCEQHLSLTYNGFEQDQCTPTYGGYSTQIVVHENYILTIPHTLASNNPLANIAPLLCAGITTYSPLRRFNIQAGKKIAIVGLGGLGHVGVKLANAMGAHVTVVSTSPSKENDAKKLGAHDFILANNELTACTSRFDFILDTVSAMHDFNAYLGLLKRGGTMVLVGVPPQPSTILATSLITNRRQLAGSLIGGIAETQAMLDYCAEKNITADVEIIGIQQLDRAYERILKSEVKYRFVIDLATLKTIE